MTTTDTAPIPAMHPRACARAMAAVIDGAMAHKVHGERYEVRRGSTVLAVVVPSRPAAPVALYEVGSDERSWAIMTLCDECAEEARAAGSEVDAIAGEADSWCNKCLRNARPEQSADEVAA
jgi:hypothetical protein